MPPKSLNQNILNRGVANFNATTTDVLMQRHHQNDSCTKQNLFVLGRPRGRRWHNLVKSFPVQVFGMGFVKQQKWFPFHNAATHVQNAKKFLPILGVCIISGWLRGRWVAARGIDQFYVMLKADGQNPVNQNARQDGRIFLDERQRFVYEQFAELRLIRGDSCEQCLDQSGLQC